MKVKVIFGLLVSLTAVHIYASTLKDIVGTVLDTNPTVNERFKNYQATAAEIGIAEAGYYPTVNLESAVGRKTTGTLSNQAIHQSYNVFQNSLILRQNVFNGFATNEQVNYQKMRALSAAYNYLDTVNDLALQTVKAYVNLQQEQALLENSERNVQHNIGIYNKVQKAYDAGLTTYSEVSKMRSTLSLAKSNLMLQKNKLLNAQSTFRRVVGNTISLKALHKVNFNLKLPSTQRKAENYALEYSPSVLAGKYNIKGAKALYRESKSTFYPKVNLELSQNYNDNYNEFVGTDDRTQGLIVLSYNLYNGGADEAKKLNALSKMNQEVSMVNDIKREVTERVALSWNSYHLALEQIPFLKQYKAQSKKTLSLYQEEYELGSRSLLDLISIENDLKRANDELIYAQYNLLLAKYHIMHSMGLTLVSIMGNQSQYYQRVGIHPHIKRNPKKNKFSYQDLDQAMQADRKSNPSDKPKDIDTMSSKVNKSMPTHRNVSKSTQNVENTKSHKTGSFLDELKKVRWESR